MQPSEFADLVVMVVKASLAPLQERCAALEQANKDLQGRIAEVSGLHDRVLVIETKTLHPVVTVPEIARWPNAPEDLEPLRAQIKALEAREPIPGPAGKDGLDGKDGAPGLAGERGERGPEGPQGTPGRDGRDGLPGPVGEKGQDGLHGKDGAPGLSGKDGLHGKDGAPGLSFEGVWQEGKTYDVGQLATWSGSSWHCNETTTSKPGESKAWTLMVKRGRDGRDGVDAPTVPVVKVGVGRGGELAVMAAMVTLTLAKSHLRITTSDGDTYLQTQIDQAIATIIDYLKESGNPNWTDLTVPFPVQAAMLIYLTHLWKRNDDVKADADVWQAIDRLLVRFTTSSLA